MNRLAIIGNPVSHSLSPLIFNDIAEDYNIDLHYTRVCGNNLFETLKLLKNLKIDAFNITAPYKKLASNITTIKDKFTEKSGFTNLIVLDQNLCAYNTDIFAISTLITNVLHSDYNKRILILGGGDTALTSMHAALSLGFNQIDLAIRDTSTYDINSLDSRVNLISLNTIKSFKNYDLLINTIPKNDFISAESIDNTKLTIIDAIYHKPYLAEANCNYISGIDWLTLQAVPTIKMLFNLDINDDILKSNLFNNKPLKKNIVISGFMGSGKSTLGKALAGSLNRHFLDVDLEIEKTNGISISEIFGKYGEEHFRKLEKDLIFKIPKDSDYVISIGGGSLVDEEVRNYVKQNFFVIYLYSDIETIIDRIKEDTKLRPLANFDNIKNLYDIRENLYFSSSDLIINNSNNLQTSIDILTNEIHTAF